MAGQRHHHRIRRPRRQRRRPSPPPGLPFQQPPHPDADSARPQLRRPRPAAHCRRARRPLHAAGERPRHRRRVRRRLAAANGLHDARSEHRRPDLRYTRNAAGGYDKRYDHQDAQNNAVAVTDGNGALVGAPLFDAWGNAVPGAQLGRIERYGDTGREPDASGLIYYRARYDDPTLARFTQRDPSGLAGGLNPYAYVGNDPVNYIDPSGLVRASPVSTSHETAYGGGDCLSVNDGYGDDGETLTDAEVARGEVEFGEGAVRLAYLQCMEWDDGRTGRIAASPDPRAGSIEHQLAPYMQEAMVNVMAGSAIKALVGTVGAVVSRGTMLVREALVGGEAAVAAETGVQATQPNRINSVRELIRRAYEPGPFQNFPESFNAEIFQSGTRTVTPNFYRTARPNMSNDSIMYSLPEQVNGRTGVFEIGVRPSASGNSEVITHRFFRRNP
ncbi:RHS repeat-associated core domain-containing protein [Accumulibacter sp.]|uniref:RHS repeat-associated core domain-containing protein n=1 Tax=Accumulibacter sp. TaxID=2053492 RepID=UPI00260C8F23|nr:RHS repeat-associated core domain-containing protein [Accumulibacter sp.]